MTSGKMILLMALAILFASCAPEYQGPATPPGAGLLEPVTDDPVLTRMVDGGMDNISPMEAVNALKAGLKISGDAHLATGANRAPDGNYQWAREEMLFEGTMSSPTGAPELVGILNAPMSPISGDVSWPEDGARILVSGRLEKTSSVYGACERMLYVSGVTPHGNSRHYLNGADVPGPAEGTIVTPRSAVGYHSAGIEVTGTAVKFYNPTFSTRIVYLNGAMTTGTVEIAIVGRLEHVHWTPVIVSDCGVFKVEPEDIGMAIDDGDYGTFSVIGLGMDVIVEGDLTATSAPSVTITNFYEEGANETEG